jgi:hypothetical protein
MIERGPFESEESFYGRLLDKLDAARAARARAADDETMRTAKMYSSAWMEAAQRVVARQMAERAGV